MTSPTGPNVKRRPRNRKDQVVGQAHELFVEHGFTRVPMAAIAEAVGITAGALYRHFDNKTDLLAAVFDSRFTFLDSPIPHGTLEDLIDFGVETVEQNPTVGILWARELRYLPEQMKTKMRIRFRTWSLTMLPLLESLRPDLERRQHELLIWSFTSAFASLYAQTGGTPKDIRTEVVRETISTLIRIPLGEIGPRVNDGSRLMPQSRRERLLQAAIDQFGRYGYSESSMSSIGTTADVTGQNIYSYFASKDDLLQAVIERGIQAPWFVLNRILATSDSATEALHRMVDAQLTFSPMWTRWTVEPEYGAERLSLLRSSQREFANEWAALLRESCPGLSDHAARVRVGIATAILSDLKQMPGISQRSGFSRNVGAIARAVLSHQVDVDHTDSSGS